MSTDTITFTPDQLVAEYLELLPLKMIGPTLNAIIKRVISEGEFLDIVSNNLHLKDLEVFEKAYVKQMAKRNAIKARLNVSVDEIVTVAQPQVVSQKIVHTEPEAPKKPKSRNAFADETTF